MFYSGSWGRIKRKKRSNLKIFLKSRPNLRSCKLLKTFLKKVKTLSKTIRRQRATQFKFKRPGFLKDNLEGLPAGSLIEVSGEAGTGKTCFALETAAAALSNNQKRSNSLKINFERFLKLRTFHFLRRTISERETVANCWDGL